MDRRKFLLGASTLALGPSAQGLVTPALAQGKPSQIVEMTWGGLWGDCMKDGADAAFEKATGIKVVQDRGSTPGERITKVKLSLDDQKFDVVQLHDGIVPLAVAQGTLEPINRNSPRLTNLKNVPDQFIQSHWVAMTVRGPARYFIGILTGNATDISRSDRYISPARHHVRAFGVRRKIESE